MKTHTQSDSGKHTLRLRSALCQTVQMLQLYQVEIDRRVAGGAMKHAKVFDVLNANANEALADSRAALDLVDGGVT